MLYIAIGIVGTIWFIYSCVTIGTLLGATLGGLPGFFFSYVSMVTSLGVTLVVLPGFLCYGVSTGTSRGATFGGLPGILFLCFHPWSWCLVLLLPCGVSIHYLCSLLVLFYNHLTPPSIIPVS